LSSNCRGKDVFPSIKIPAPNKRFGARRGVRPQKVLSDFQAFAPARTFVNPRPVAKPPTVIDKRAEAQSQIDSITINIEKYDRRIKTVRKVN
jgi:hypothetical protein